MYTIKLIYRYSPEYIWAYIIGAIICGIIFWFSLDSTIKDTCKKEGIPPVPTSKYFFGWLLGTIFWPFTILVGIAGAICAIK